MRWLAASDLPANDVLEGIDRLVASQMIDRRGTGVPARYGFRQALIQDIAYESLLRERRRRIHQAVANHLEQEDLENATNRPETLARHLSEAGEWARAADYWLRAAEIAKARFANAEAAEHLDAGLVADEKDPAARCDRRAAMMTIYGDLESRAGNLESANAWYDKAIEVADELASRQAIENHRHRPRRTIRDGASLAFYEHGNGEETLLFVNPAIYGLATFQPILEQLCHEFRIITIDCRGTGASDPLARPFPVSEHVDDLVAILGELDAGPITGVGISRGSSHLIRLSANRPELLSKLVLVGASVASLKPHPKYGPPEDFLEKIRAELKQGDLKSTWRAQVAQIFTEPGTRHLAEQFLENNLNLPSETVLNFYEPDPEIDVRPLLSNVAVPTLVMHGTEDQLLPFAGAEYLAEHIRGAELYAFDGKGHLPLFTATAEFCTVLRTFVTSGKLER
jgi:pimeloyl-ACP methyl ester carboxylesterase